MGLGLPHLGFFTKKGNRETHRFHQWMISSLCFTYSWDRNLGSEKKTSTGNVFYSFLYVKYMQLFFHNPILGRKTLWCHQTRLENPRSECFQLWNSSARHVWLPSDNWALSIYNFPTKTFIILYLSRIFHFKEDVFPTILQMMLVTKTSIEIGGFPTENLNVVTPRRPPFHVAPGVFFCLCLLRWAMELVKTS